ncbi:hypothetical protein CW710_00700 [Candidatus Bathyarchaeota archaeon]|nr:MAG: hypothetical protein CW710_00700 [Candidatus Bathyarchaeota archaeon]
MTPRGRSLLELGNEHSLLERALQTLKTLGFGINSDNVFKSFYIIERNTFLRVKNSRNLKKRGCKIRIFK